MAQEELVDGAEGLGASDVCAGMGIFSNSNGCSRGSSAAKDGLGIGSPCNSRLISSTLALFLCL